MCLPNLHFESPSVLVSISISRALIGTDYFYYTFTLRIICRQVSLKAPTHGRLIHLAVALDLYAPLGLLIFLVSTTYHVMEHSC